MPDMFELLTPTNTVEGAATARAAAVVDTGVIVYLNTATYTLGRPVGVIDGYQSGHTLERAVIYRIPLLPNAVGISVTFEQLSFDLNVGDDRAFVEVQK